MVQSHVSYRWTTSQWTGGTLESSGTRNAGQTSSFVRAVRPLGVDFCGGPSIRCRPAVHLPVLRALLLVVGDRGRCRRGRGLLEGRGRALVPRGGGGRRGGRGGPVPSERWWRQPDPQAARRRLWVPVGGEPLPAPRGAGGAAEAAHLPAVPVPFPSVPRWRLAGPDAQLLVSDR